MQHRLKQPVGSVCVYVCVQHSISPKVAVVRQGVGCLMTVRSRSQQWIDCKRTVRRLFARGSIADSESPAQMHEFECACKTVRVQLSGDALHQHLCHCTNCREFNQTCPVALAMYNRSSFKVTQGADSIATVSLANPEIVRCFCQKCGYRLYNGKDEVIVIPAANLETLDFKPAAHLYCKDAYKDSLTRFRDDGIPKWVKLPPYWGGPDEQVSV